MFRFLLLELLTLTIRVDGVHVDMLPHQGIEYTKTSTTLLVTLLQQLQWVLDQQLTRLREQRLKYLQVRLILLINRECADHLKGLVDLINVEEQYPVCLLQQTNFLGRHLHAR